MRQGIATDQGTLSGKVTTPYLSPGYTFELTQPDASSVKVARLMRQSFSGRTFVVTSIQHHLSDTSPYTGTVQATEVNENNESDSATLLTPFTMEHTQQGSVLAKVMQTAVPKGWRFREKSNYQIEQSRTQFDNQSEKEIGCLVQFATATDPDDLVWVRLSSHTQTAPEVGAMVMVSRANNDSELPEISVMASHGSKTIQPPDRRNQSWTANTSWGSNYSASYGDGISMRWGYNSAVNFDQAKGLVEKAYDDPDMLGNSYDNSGFSKGGGFNVSVSNQGADGVSSASVSAGCGYNENHAKISYGYSDTGVSQNYSQVGKTVSCSVIGDYSGQLDLDDVSFINGKVPNQEIIDIADSLAQGDTYNRNYIKGKTISLSGTGTPPPSYGATSDRVYSDSVTVGNVFNQSMQQGNVVSNSTHLGDNTSTSLQQGDATSTNTHTGNRHDTTTRTGNNTSLSTTVGITDAVDTFVGAKNTVSTSVAATNAINTNVAASNTIDTNVGLSNSIRTDISASNSIATSISARNAIETNIGASNSISTNLSANNSMSTTLGVTNHMETYLGMKNSISTFMGMTNDTNMFLGVSNSTKMSLASNINTALSVGANIDTVINGAINMETKITAGINITNNTNSAIHLDLNPAPTKIKPVKAEVEIDIESGPNIKMLVIEIVM